MPYSVTFRDALTISRPKARRMRMIKKAEMLKAIRSQIKIATQYCNVVTPFMY